MIVKLAQPGNQEKRKLSQPGRRPFQNLPQGVYGLQLENPPNVNIHHDYEHDTKHLSISNCLHRIRPALLRQASYGTIKIGCYHTFKRILVENPEHETLPINVVCGVAAGVFASSLANPTDVLKVRMQAQGTSFAQTNGMMHSFVTIYQQEGTKGLWRVSLIPRGAIHPWQSGDWRGSYFSPFVSLSPTFPFSGPLTE